MAFQGFGFQCSGFRGSISGISYETRRFRKNSGFTKRHSGLDPEFSAHSMYWMPDQVRNDKSGTLEDHQNFIAQVSLSIKLAASAASGWADTRHADT